MAGLRHNSNTRAAADAAHSAVSQFSFYAYFLAGRSLVSVTCFAFVLLAFPVVDPRILELKEKGNTMHNKRPFPDFVAAVYWYTRALELAPNDHALFSNRAASYSGMGWHLNALEDAEECIERSPSWYKGYFRKGVALMGMFRFDEAVPAFSRALDSDLGPNEKADITEKFHEAFGARADWGASKISSWKNPALSSNIPGKLLLSYFELQGNMFFLAHFSLPGSASPFSFYPR